MFSRFTEKAIQSIMLAQEEAKRFHHSYVGTEHILLGIIGEGNNVVNRVIQELGFSSDQVKSAIEERLEYGSISSDYGNIPFTQHAKQILTHAWDEARKLGHNYVNLEHLFLSIFRDPTSLASRVLAELGIQQNNFKELLLKQLGEKVHVTHKQTSKLPTPTLDLFGRDLTWLAKEGKLDPVVGRAKEITRVIQILCRRSKNNPVLTGEAGVGKTAIVEGLAQKIIAGEVPEKLIDKRVISLDLGLMVAGTKYRGEFEDRIKKVMEEARKAENVIVFIDELHTIIGTGGSEGSLDAANLFKPALARGELQCIGATTLDEYRKHIEGDGALERRFQSIFIEEPSSEETVRILKGIRERYESFHQVTITDEALVEAVELSQRYINERFLPDKAVDVLDEAAVKVMLMASSPKPEIKLLFDELDKVEKEKKLAQKKTDKSLIKLLNDKQKSLQLQTRDFPKDEIDSLRKMVTPAAVADVVSLWTGIPVTRLTVEETKRLLTMEATLKSTIIGQDEAIESLTRSVKRAKSGLKDPKRPTGSFLFLGPTGVGKSELAKQLAEFLFGSEDAMIRVDMSEFMEKHTVSKLIGSPPGYVGYNEGGQLTEPIRRKPYSVVLFDEIEKASPDVTNILLQIMEDGHITDSNNRKVSFKNALIIMTSNVGSRFIQNQTAFGFVDAKKIDQTKSDVLKAKLQDELHREFKPEFLNRIDDIIIFKSLLKKHIGLIVDIMLNDVQARVKKENVIFNIDKKTKTFLVDKGFDEKLGARPLRRAIQRYFEDELADQLLKSGSLKNIQINATVKQKKIVFTIKKIPAQLVKKISNKKPAKKKELIA